MGLLKKLLSPKNMVHSMVDPVGATVGTAVTGNTGLSSYYDPVGLMKKSGGDSSSPAATATDPSADAGIYGDQGDPAYGSFTKPFDAEEFYKYEDPGYWFRLQQGQQALQNSAAAGSGALSGSALKDLLGYNQDMASTEYNNAFNRYQTTQGNIFQRLMGIAQLGQSSAAQTGSIGATLAGNAGANISNAGTAAGSGIVGAGNSINNGATNAWLWSQFNQKPMAAAGTG